MKKFLTLFWLLGPIACFAQPKDDYGRTQSQREWQDYNSHYNQRVSDIQSRPSAYGDVSDGRPSLVPQKPRELTVAEKAELRRQGEIFKSEQKRKDSLNRVAEISWESQKMNFVLNQKNGADTSLSFSFREACWLNAIRFVDSCNIALAQKNDYLKYLDPNFTPFPPITTWELNHHLANLYFDYKDYRNAADYYKRVLFGKDKVNAQTQHFVRGRIQYYSLISADYSGSNVQECKMLYETDKNFIYYLAYAQFLRKQVDSARIILDGALKNNYFKDAGDIYPLFNNLIATLLYQNKDNEALELYNQIIPQKAKDIAALKETITNKMAVEIESNLRQYKKIPVQTMLALDLLNLLQPQNKAYANVRHWVFTKLESNRGMRPIDQLWLEPVMPIVVPENPDDVKRKSAEGQAQIWKDSLYAMLDYVIAHPVVSKSEIGDRFNYSSNSFTIGYIYDNDKKNYGYSYPVTTNSSGFLSYTTEGICARSIEATLDNFATARGLKKLETTKKGKQLDKFEKEHYGCIKEISYEDPSGRKIMSIQLFCKQEHNGIERPIIYITINP